MQSKKASLLEQLGNTGSGFLLSMVVWHFIAAPYLGLPTDVSTNIVITILFTVISIVRGYLWRRLGNYFSTRGVA